jgi:hypothetical protein
LRCRRAAEIGTKLMAFSSVRRHGVQCFDG